MGFIKKSVSFVGKTVGTVVVGAVGVASAVIEDFSVAGGSEIIEELSYGAKNACFNSVRKMWGKEEKEMPHQSGRAAASKLEQVQEIRERQVELINKELDKAEDLSHKTNLSSEQRERLKERVNQLERKQEELSQKNKIPTVSYQQGYISCPTAFVFSCPGQKEMLAGHVCAGTTGSNLVTVLEYCHSKKPDVFPYATKGAYLITNASNIVHFKSLTNDTEASDEELLKKENLQRLKDELSGKKTIICMGKKAETAISNAGVPGRIVYFEHHLSNQKLNRSIPNRDLETNTPDERRAERLRIVAEELLKLV